MFPWMDDIEELTEKLDEAKRALYGLRYFNLVKYCHPDKKDKEEIGKKDPGWTYLGPRVYEEWRMNWLNRYSNIIAKELKVQVKKELFDPEKYPMPKRQMESVFRNLNGWNFKEKIREEKFKKMDLSTLTDEQRRSYDNRFNVCKCGGKRIVNGKVCWYGGKRKLRCRKCQGCKSSNCGRCVNCLNPRNKQACVNKVCLFPNLPDCPCFR